MHILLTDDHSMFRAGLRRIISEAFPNALIREAASCAECLEVVRSADIDLIILDVSMQGQNSLSILPDIRKARPTVRIVILSMHSEHEFVVQALRAGASAYLTKEHTDEELVDAINAILSGGRYVSSRMALNLLDYVASGTADAAPHHSLSSRERQVFDLLATGVTLSQIAVQLNLSTKTVSTYRTRILEKMSFGSNADLIKYAVRHGLVAAV
jgi:DNA-binding NarL/FixJ family response regulator